MKLSVFRSGYWRTFVAIEAIIAGVVIASLAQKYLSVESGWSLLVGIAVFVAYNFLFEKFEMFRICVVVIITPLVMIAAYVIGDGIGGYPVAVALSILLAVIVVAEHLPPTVRAARGLVRGRALNSFKQAKERSAALMQQTTQE